MEMIGTIIFRFITNVIKCQKKDTRDIINIDVVGGDKNTVSASYSAEIHVLNPQLVTVECYYFPFLYAPAEKGSEIGRVIIKFKEKGK